MHAFLSEDIMTYECVMFVLQRELCAEAAEAGRDATCAGGDRTQTGSGTLQHC